MACVYVHLARNSKEVCGTHGRVDIITPQTELYTIQFGDKQVWACDLVNTVIANNPIHKVTQLGH